MDRKEFLTALGLGTASVAIFNCVGCKKSSESAPAPTNVDFTLDLSSSANAALTANGGYIYNSGVIVARTSTGSFIAVSQTCTHETYRVNYQPTQHLFFCANHGATFSENGAVTSGPAKTALQQYHTQLSGTSLRIYS